MQSLKLHILSIIEIFLLTPTFCMDSSSPFIDLIKCDQYCGYCFQSKICGIKYEFDVRDKPYASLKNHKRVLPLNFLPAEVSSR